MSKLPLCVDLDGTLVKTDLLVEAVFHLAKERPASIPLLPVWLLKGKAAFKHEVFSRVALDAASLPYDEAFLEFLKQEKASGRMLVLATASPRVAAENVAKHLGIFDCIIATSAETNLAGKNKAEALVQQFGEKKFAYAANAPVDLTVWRDAGEALIVGEDAVDLTKRVESVTRVAHVFERKSNTLKLVLKAMRVHQWAKNVLIFAPLIFAHRVGNTSALMAALWAFCCFTLVSSSVYLINDLLDLDSDRRHVDNRRRPFASGDLPLHYGVVMAPLLFSAGMLLAAFFSAKFFAVILGYFVVTFAYSVRLKEVAVADVLILAFLYAWRVIAGAVATGVALSHWFLAFFSFLFFSLALVKRCSELILTAKHNQKENARRGYLVSDLSQLASFGSASGYIAVLVLALYINDDVVGATYRYRQALWLLCPLLLYWVSRMWLFAHRGQMTSDPLVFSMKDRVSYIIIAAMGLIWLIASGGL